MPETTTLTRGRGLRSVSARVKSDSLIFNSASTASAVQRHDAAETALGRKEDTNCDDDVVALQAMVMERTEQVERLEALLSEKQFLWRRDEALKERMRYYEEQLAQLVTIVREDTPTSNVVTAAIANNKASVQEKKQQRNATLGAQKNKLEISLREVYDSVLKLRYENCRMERELQGKEKLLNAMRDERKQEQSEGNVAELPLGKNSVDVNPYTVMTAALPVQKAEVVGRDKMDTVQHEQKLTELQEKLRTVERRVETYRKDCTALRRRLHDSEKEVLTWQRRHREALETQGKKSQHLPSTQWKSAIQKVSSRHSHFFRGAEWVELVKEKPEAMRSAFLNDISLELSAPREFVAVVEMRPGPDVVTVDVDVRRPVSLSGEQVDLCLMECPFKEVKQLLKCKDEPKKDWDMVKEQLHMSRRTIVEKDTELVRLQEQLKLAEMSLQQQRDERDTSNRLIHQALDETEETIKAMYDELQNQREKKRQFQEELQSVKETLAARDKTIEELTVQLQQTRQQEERTVQELDEARRKASTELREVEEKWRQGQILRTAPKTRVVRHSFAVDCSSHDKTTVVTLGPNGDDILRTLLLGEIAVTAKAVPLKILSMICTGKEVQAEVELQMNSLAANAVKNMQNCRTPISALFIQEWFAMKNRVDSCSRETERLLQEMNAMSEKAEKNRILLTEELSRINEALNHKDTSLSPAVHVAHLVATLEKAEKSKTLHEQKWHKEREQVQALEKEVQHLQQKYAASQERFSVQTRKLLELQLKRQRVFDDVAEVAKNKLQLEQDVIAALQRSYEECDKLQKTLDACVQQQQVTENSLREKLSKRDAECEQLHLRLSALHKELRERQMAMATSKSTHQRSEAERDDLINRIQQEMQTLSKKLAKNDALQRETENGKKALEVRVTELQERCDAYEDERKKLRERSTLLEEDSAALQKRVEELQSEIASRSQRAEEMMRQLVHEEDARRSIEAELLALRRSKTTGTSNGKEEGIATMLEVKRLRSFCVQVLNLSLTEKQETLGDILALMERHQKVAAAAEKEKLTGALLSLNTVLQLLKQCVSMAEESKEGLPHVSLGLVNTDKNGNSDVSGGGLSNFSRSLSHSSGVSPSVQSVRVPQLSSIKSGTPTLLVRRGSGELQPQDHNYRLHESDNMQWSTLTDTTTEILRLTELLTGVVTYWKDEVTQKTTQFDELSNKFCELSEELNRIQFEVLKHQENQEPLSSLVDSDPLRDDGDYDFLRRSRAHALCVTLSVKDQLHDALAALQPVAIAVSDGNLVIRGGCPVDISHSLRLGEKCVLHALKRIVNSVSVIFSMKERQEIETRRGVDYFASPVAWSDATSVLSSSCVYSPPALQTWRCTKGLLSRDVNTLPLSPLARE